MHTPAPFPLLAAMGNTHAAQVKRHGKRMQRMRRVLASMLNPGDLVLIYERSRAPFGRVLDDNIMRGLVCTQEAKSFSVQHRQLDGWTSAGIVSVSLDDGQSYLLEATSVGLSCLPLVPRVEQLQREGAVVRADRPHVRARSRMLHLLTRSWLLAHSWQRGPCATRIPTAWWMCAIAWHRCAHTLRTGTCFASTPCPAPRCPLPPPRRSSMRLPRSCSS